jgi:hypothetical protein
MNPKFWYYDHEIYRRQKSSYTEGFVRAERSEMLDKDYK